jgi:hypothetical protein
MVGVASDWLDGLTQRLNPHQRQYIMQSGSTTHQGLERVVLAYALLARALRYLSRIAVNRK